MAITLSNAYATANFLINDNFSVTTAFSFYSDILHNVYGLHSFKYFIIMHMAIVLSYTIIIMLMAIVPSHTLSSCLSLLFFQILLSLWTLFFEILVIICL